jgi:glyoxylase-like metal-dependent hydrolase (beta-lactamase superfamily II)
MHWERATDDVYVFTCDRYAQVTATLIVSGGIGVIIDTLPFPRDTAQLAMTAHKMCPSGVRYIIYTQHQADHVFGAYYFPRAEIISHTLCRQLLIDKGFAALERTKAQSPEFEFAKLRLPTITFDTGTFSLRLPGRTLEMIHTPGHTPDSISVLLQEEKILFAGDTVMALPTVAEGDVAQLHASLEMIGSMPLDSIVQGHGDIVLRGEIKDHIKKSLNYLEQLDVRMHDAFEKGYSREEVKAITIESCGMQRAMLNGVVNSLHVANVLGIYDRLSKGKTVKTRVKPTTKIEPVAPPPPSKPSKKDRTVDLEDDEFEEIDLDEMEPPDDLDFENEFDVDLEEKPKPKPKRASRGRGKKA